MEETASGKIGRHESVWPFRGHVVGTEGAEIAKSQMQKGLRHLAEEPGLYLIPTFPA